MISRTKYYLAGAVSFLTFLVYLPSLRNSILLWDDSLYVTENTNISSLDLTFFKWAFSSFYASNWHPLTWISHAIDYAVWELNPMGHHLTNNILHTANTFLVILLVAKLLETTVPTAPCQGVEPDRMSTTLNERRTLIAATTTGLLFGLHPLHVESVAWVSERKDLLCALFYLLGLLSYMTYAAQRTYRTYALTLLFFIFALLSKPMAVSLPFVLLILDWHPFQRVRSIRTFLYVSAEKIPFFALSILSSLVTLMAQKSGDALTMNEYVPLSTRTLVAAGSLINYIRNMAVPLNLMPFYPYPTNISLWSPSYIFPVVLVTGITIICIFLAGRHKLWLSAWSYYVVTLLPVLGIVQVGEQSMADRYTYLPSLGLFLIIGLISAYIYKKVISLKQPRPAMTAAGLIGLAALVWLSYGTIRQIGIWKNDISLWSHVIEIEPNRIAFAYQNRGYFFHQSGNLDRAIADYTEVINLEPFGHSLTYYNRGDAYYSIGLKDKALEDFNTAILLNPDYTNAYYNRGLIQFEKGDRNLAALDFRKACELGLKKGCDRLQGMQFSTGGN